MAAACPLTCAQVGPPTTGYLKFNVTCTPLGEVAEDGMTEMSGMTSEADQDLDGERPCVCHLLLLSWGCRDV
jgi:hypothetical protein